MKCDRNFSMEHKYESPTVEFIAVAAEGGFAASIFGDEGAAGGDLFDDDDDNYYEI